MGEITLEVLADPRLGFPTSSRHKHMKKFMFEKRYHWSLFETTLGSAFGGLMIWVIVSVAK